MKQYFTHGISLEGNTYLNVLRKLSYQPNDARKYPFINFDFHGFALSSYAPPAWNLFDNLYGFHYMDGGGAPKNQPHTAKGNVWWNIEVGQDVQKPEEIFYDWIWGVKAYESADYEFYPGSILVGYGNKTTTFTIEKSTSNFRNKFLYTEFLNELDFSPKSLYEAQLNLRKASINK